MSELKAKQAAVEILKRDLIKQDEIIRELVEALNEIYDAWPGQMISVVLECQLLEKVKNAIALASNQDNNEEMAEILDKNT